MLRLVLISALVALSVGYVPRVRSPLPQLDGRIVGGEQVDIEDYPYQCSLQIYGFHICGCSVLGDKWILTAAHCTDGWSATSLNIQAGSSVLEVGGQSIKVAKIHQHPQYNSGTIDYDISVLELSAAVEFGNPVEAVNLPEQDEDLPGGSDCVVTGWGTTSEGGSSPSHLRGVHLPSVSLDKCKDAYGSSSITDRMICAGFPEGGKDACQGDSGGPLVSGGKQVGVVSWGFGCARPNYPGVFSSVANLRGYIKEVSGI